MQMKLLELHDANFTIFAVSIERFLN
jgi:hypothetical protein